MTTTAEIDALVASASKMITSLANKAVLKLRVEGFRADFEDAKQGGRYGAWKAAKSYRPGRGTKFTTWAYKWIERYAQMAANESAGLTASRGDGIPGVVSLDTLLQEAEDSTLVNYRMTDVTAMHGDRYAVILAVRTAIRTLSDKEREVIYRTYWLEQTTREIAAVMRVGTKNTVLNILNRAYAQLRVALV